MGSERIFNLNSFTTDIIENCLFIIWRHLDFYFLHCIPSDEERRMLAGPTLAGSRMRRLQGIRLRVRILVKLSANLEKNIDSYYSFCSRNPCAVTPLPPQPPQQNAKFWISVGSKHLILHLPCLFKYLATLNFSLHCVDWLCLSVHRKASNRVLLIILLHEKFL